MPELSRRRAVPFLLALCAAASLPAAADAQGITLAAGARTYDEGGSATMVAIRTEFPICTAALLEFASSTA